jgi:hypothetical protein
VKNAYLRVLDSRLRGNYERIAVYDQTSQIQKLSCPATRAILHGMSAAELLSLNRNHWHIENQLHWVRDVTFGEDNCRAKVGDSPQNLAALRNVSITLLRLSGCKGIASTLRDFATKPLDLLKFLAILKN